MLRALASFMPTTSLQKFTRTLDRSLNAFGEALSSLVLLIIKLSLLALFFAYLVGFAYEVVSPGGVWAIVAIVFVIAVGVVCLISMIWAVVNASQEEKKTEPAALVRGSIWPFIALVALPLGIVIIVDVCFSYQFKSFLLMETQIRLNKLFSGMGHL
jgi:hypothetical protein